MLITGPGFTVPTKAATGGSQTGTPFGFANELLISEIYPKFYSLIKAGLCFEQVVSGNPTAFTGGAGGTPLLGLYNPANSGKDLVILITRASVKTSGTAAVAWDLAWWKGVSTLPTGTTTPARAAYSTAAGGAVGVSFVNTAMTGSTALAVGPIPALSGGLTAATAVTNVSPALFEEDGALVIAPGNLAAIGSSGTLTAAVIDLSVLWAELPA